MTAHVHAEPTEQEKLDAAVQAYMAEQNEGGSLFACVSEAIRVYGEAKPRTHKVNGIEVPEPMRKMPSVGSQYFIADNTSSEWHVTAFWRGDSFDRMALQRGLVHATEEAAVANAKAMLGEQP